MIKTTTIKRTFIYLTILTAFLVGSCAPRGGPNEGGQVQRDPIAIDPSFRDFYDTLGGRNVLGPAISPIFTFETRKFQYTEKACLEFNPDLPASMQFRLSSLGRDLGLDLPFEPAPSTPDPLYVNGFYIYPAFYPLYQQLGQEIVGDPLSGIHYNPEKKRFEQYFERLGFYWNEDEPATSVKLLSYGDWKCGSFCEYTPPLESLVDLVKVPPSQSDEIFRQTVARIGADLTGFPISTAYTSADGKVEKVYENAVLAYDPLNPALVFLRPLSEAVGIIPQPMVPASTMSGMVFWHIENNLGYNVPQPFFDYIEAHGGVDVVGQPMGVVTINSENIYRQCFTNLCLEYHGNESIPVDLRIRPGSLGSAYQDMFTHGQNNIIDIDAVRSIRIQVWEKFQYISNTESQEISAAVFDGDIPLEHISPLLVVDYPDGRRGSYYFPPTGKDGITSFLLEPIDATLGSVVPYLVCLNMVGQDLFCVKESFVIWFNP